MKTWNPYPLVRLFFPFAIGIITAIYAGFTAHIPWGVFVGLLLISGFYIFYFARKISYKTRWVFGLFLYLLLFCCGYELTLLRTPSSQPDHFLHLGQAGANTLVRITAPPQIREKSIKAEAEMMLNGDSAAVVPCSGQLMLYFAADSQAAALAYGDLVLIQKVPEVVAPTANPGAFNYKQYLANRGVYHQLFVRNQDWRRIGQGERNPIYAIAYRARAFLLNILASNGLEGREFAVTSALLIGYTDKLDADLLNDYSGTGAMHILSVSGMHVGLIYVVLNLLLFFFDKWRYGKLPKAALLLVFIWIYALITGLSPSVLRAATMFSLIIIGNSFSRTSDIFNSLAASAVALLIINPYFITDMGFQLSYVAVVGIVALQPVIQSWWTPKWWLIKQGWSITSVSVAAQIATFPLGLYYFHQFPNYFLITNIVALPLSSGIIYLALIVLAFSVFPAISIWLAKVLSWGVLALNTSISWIEGLPGSVSRGAYINGYETLIIYGIVIAVIVYVFSKRKTALWLGLMLAIGLYTSFFVRQLKTETQQSMVVYNAGKSCALDFIRQRERLLLADSAILTDAQKIDYCSSGWVEMKGVRVFSSLNVRNDVPNALQSGFFKYHNFVQFMDQRMVWVDCKETADTKMNVDFLILCRNANVNIDELLAIYTPEMIVIDATNSTKMKEQWLKECSDRGIRCWSVADQGALVWEAS